MPYRQDLHDLTAPAVAAVGCELWGVEYLSQGRHSILRIYIDKASGITIDDCEAASHQISGVLDVEDPIVGEYNLEVSSPGLDRPLFRVEHFTWAQGQQIRVKVQRPIDGQRQFQGVVQTVTQNELVLQCDNQPVCLPLADVVKANVIATI